MARRSVSMHIADIAEDTGYRSGQPARSHDSRSVRHPYSADRCRCSRTSELVGAIVHLPPGGATVHRQADRAGAELRRPGRHRHREHAAAQRTAPAHRRSERVAGAADRDLGGAEGHHQFARRTGAGVRGDAGERDPHLRGQVRHACSATTASYSTASPCIGTPPELVEFQRQRGPFQSAKPDTTCSAACCGQKVVAHVLDDAAQIRRRCHPAKYRRRAISLSQCRCSRTTSWSAPSSSTARRCARSPTSRSSWCRTSPPRPSSPSRTRGCSTSCASAPTI